LLPFGLENGDSQAIKLDDDSFIGQNDTTYQFYGFEENILYALCKL
jgi:hypothetical protein